MNGSGAGWVDGKTYTTRNGSVVLMAVLEVLAAPIRVSAQTADLIGKELSVPQHLEDGQEFQLSITELIAFGSRLFSARWTTQEGQGRPQTKGTGSPLSDPALPLTFPRNFNRLSGPDANSCAGCHNTPFLGAGGDRVSEVFVLGQRFDFLDFDHSNGMVLGAPRMNRGDS